MLNSSALPPSLQAAAQGVAWSTEPRCPPSPIEQQQMRRGHRGHFHPWNEGSMELHHCRLCSVLCPFSLLFCPFFSTRFHRLLHRLDGTNAWGATLLCYVWRSKNGLKKRERFKKKKRLKQVDLQGGGGIYLSKARKWFRSQRPQGGECY